MALILTIENETSLPNGAPISVRLTGGRNLDIGRGAHLDWPLPDPSRFISGKHCEVRFRDGAYWLYDVSTNGTFLNDSTRRIQAPHRLAPGDRVAVGPYVIIVSVEAEETPAEQPSQVAAEASPPGVVEPAPTLEAHDAVFDRQAESEAIAAGSDAIDTKPDVSATQAAAPLIDVLPLVMPKAAPLAVSTTAEERVPEQSTAPEPDAQPLEESVACATPPSKAEEIPPPMEAEALPMASGGARRIEAGADLAASAAPPVAAGNAVSEPDEFLRRFAAGAGIPDQIFARRDGLKVAEELGGLMRLVVENMTLLLSARFKAKRFARTSNQTMIQALDNNPLKFAPTAEDALKIMFGPRTSGYLDARRALDGAFADLKTHQIKTFSAMQHAVKMLIEDLDPAEIDTAIGPDKGIAAFFTPRKSRLWDMYLARWQAKTLRHEDGLTDAFHALLRRVL